MDCASHSCPPTVKFGSTPTALGGVLLWAVLFVVDERHDTLATMAKRSTAIVRTIPVRAPAPVIRIAAPRAPTAAKSKRRSHRRSSGGGITGKTVLSAGIGGAALGFIEKTFPNIPTVPVLGRAGTIALAAYFLSRRGGTGMGGIARDVALAAASIAGYQLGKTGKVSGDEVLGDDELSGVAAQV